MSENVKEAKNVILDVIEAIKELKDEFEAEGDKEKPLGKYVEAAPLVFATRVEALRHVASIFRLKRGDRIKVHTADGILEGVFFSFSEGTNGSRAIVHVCEDDFRGCFTIVITAIEAA